MKLNMTATSALLLLLSTTTQGMLDTCSRSPGGHHLFSRKLNPEEVKRRFDDEYPLKLTITADNVEIHPSNALRPITSALLRKQIEAQVRTDIMEQLRGASQEFIGQQIDAMMPQILATAEASCPPRTACLDTFKRDDALPSHDGAQITWRGCTDGSNVWDIATATARQREDGSWELQDFMIQFCSTLEEECLEHDIDGTQVEFHIRAAEGGWTCTEFNELVTPADRSKGIKQIAEAGESHPTVKILDADRHATSAFLPPELAHMVGAFEAEEQLSFFQQTPGEARKDIYAAVYKMIQTMIPEEARVQIGGALPGLFAFKSFGEMPEEGQEYFAAILTSDCHDKDLETPLQLTMAELRPKFAEQLRTGKQEVQFMPISHGKTDGFTDQTGFMKEAGLLDVTPNFVAAGRPVTQPM